MRAKKLTWDLHGLAVYECNGEEWAVGTDKQADKAAALAVEDSLWAFRASFIVSFVTGLRSYPSLTTEQDAAFEKAISLVQEKLSEDAGPIIRGLIGDHLDDFTDEALRADGRGHFLSSYDGEEVDSDDVDGLPKRRVAFRVN